MSASPPVIETHGLSKRYGLRRAVDGLSLAVTPGSVFGFLGPNGAGKTTTIRMLLGLVRPSGGSGRILGHDIVRERAAFLPRVGAIVEAPAFYLFMTARNNLRVLARTAGLREPARIAEVLALVGLAERADEPVRAFSLGMKQRLALAAALLGRPELLFLDEPTNGLDPAGTVEMRDLIRRLGAEGHTIFLSSHMLHEVEQICTDVAIVRHGRLVAQGTVGALLANSAALLVEAEPLPLLAAVAERMGLATAPAGPRSMSVQAGPALAPRLISALVHAGASVFQVTPQRRTLEERFLELTED